MTAPTTREELAFWLADELFDPPGDVAVAFARRLLSRLDTFAVVCPREPDDGQIEAAYDAAQRRADLDLMVDAGEIYSMMLDASPFAPKEPTDG